MIYVLLAFTVATFAYSWYKMNHLPQQSAQMQQLKGPTATEGIPIPVLFGTRTITSCNVCWYGDQFVTSKNSTTSLYHLSVQLALCHGRLDALWDVYNGESDNSMMGAQRGFVVGSAEHQNVLLNSYGSADPGDIGGLAVFSPGGVNTSATTDAGLDGTQDYLALTMGLTKGPKYYGVANVVMTHGFTVGTSPVLQPWGFKVSRIHKRNGGATTQWYDAKAEIALGWDSTNAWKYLLVDPTDNTDYSGTSFDDSGWHENSGPIGNADASVDVWSWVASSPAGYPVPQVGHQVTGTDFPGLVAPQYTFTANQWVKSGAKLWLRQNLGALPQQDLGVRCWHDDTGTLWFNGEPVPLVPIVDASNPIYQKFNSNATIPASLVNPSGPNVIAYRVRDSFDNDGNRVGTNKFIFAGIQVGLDTYEPRRTRDMNPIHIIREVLTDSIWGAGYSDGDIGSSFTTAADTCYSENLGLSLLWDEQQTCMDFIAEILRYISGTLYINPTTGNFEIKLIRDNYTVGDLPVFDGSNTSTIHNIERQAVGQLINSVTATYSCNPRGKQGAVTVFDSGLVTAQGGIVNQKVDYPAVSTSYIAGRLALRDLRVLSSPLLSCSVGANREAEPLRPGDAFVLNRPDLGIDNMVMRVSEIDLGDGIKNEITIECLEDAFYFPAEPITKPNPPIAHPPGTVTTNVPVDTYFTAKTIDPRNQGMVETVLWANMVTTYLEEISPGVWESPTAGPFSESGASPRNTFFDGVSADAHNLTGTSWLIGKRFLVWDDATMDDATKALCGPYIVDDVGGHWENYGTINQTYVDTKFRIHRDPSYDASSDFAKDMVFQVRGGDTYALHYIQLQTANPVLGSTPLVFADQGTSFSFSDAYELLRSDQLASQTLNPDSYLNVSITGTSGDMQAFPMLPGTPGVRSLPAGTWKFTPSVVSVTGGDEGATTNLGFKIWRSGATPGLVFEVLSEAITPDMLTVSPIFYPAPTVPLNPDGSDTLVLIPTLHTTSVTAVTLTIQFNGVNAIQVQIPHSDDNGGAASSQDESFFAVAIDANGVIKDFGSRRNLLVSGAGPLKGIATDGCVGGTTVKCTFKDNATVNPNETPPGAAGIVTTQDADGNYETLAANANSVISFGLRTDAGSVVFWKSGEPNR